jgi:hypothetical protein
LAHVLIRQFSVECGYAAASLRERIYSSTPDDEEAMAGILIYTAAPDSEGTLGGLVTLGKTANLEQHLDQALEGLEICSSDPLCAETQPEQAFMSLHGAACHNCLFCPRLLASAEIGTWTGQCWCHHGAFGVSVFQAMTVAEACLRLTEDLPASVVESLICELRQGRGLSIPNPNYQARVDEFLQRWDCKTSELAPMLEVALTARRIAPTMELVWTGPATSVVPVRRTEQVLFELIQCAKRE